MDRNGFTLIEIIVSILGIGILAALVYPKPPAGHERPYEHVAKARRVAFHQQEFHEKHGRYAALEELGTIGTAFRDVETEMIQVGTSLHVRTRGVIGEDFGWAGRTGVCEVTLSPAPWWKLWGNGFPEVECRVLSRPESDSTADANSPDSRS